MTTRVVSHTTVFHATIQICKSRTKSTGDAKPAEDHGNQQGPKQRPEGCSKAMDQDPQLLSAALFRAVSCISPAVSREHLAKGE